MSQYTDLDAIYNSTSGGGFTAGGDLSGTSTNQTVIGIYGKEVANATPSSGQALIWNAGTSKWTPTTLSSGSFAAGGDLSGTDTNQTVIGLQGVAISATTPTAGQYLVLSGGVWTPTTISLTLAGDVTGGYAANSVVKIRNTALASAITSIGASDDGYVLTWVDGSSEWQALPPTGGAPTGSAGGDLSGTYPNPTVAKINATQITTAGGSLTTGTVLRATSTNSADWGAVNLANSSAVTGTLPKTNQAAQDMAGDVTGTTAVSVVAKVNGTTVSTAGGALTTGTILRVTGVASMDYGALDLANASAVTGTLPTGNQASQSMGGDVSGTTAAATVIKLRGTSLAASVGTVGASQDGYALTWDNGTSSWIPSPVASGVTFAGDLSGNETSQTVEKVKGTTITTAGGALNTGAVLRVTGAASADWGALDLADTDAVTGVLPKTNQAAQDMGGDVSGTTAASTVDKLKGTNLGASVGTVAAAQDGYVLTWDNGTSTWIPLPGSGGIDTVGAIDTNSNANGLYISGTTISTQSASASVPGMVNTTTQSFAGNKTFTGSITAGSSTTNNTLTGGCITSTFNLSSNLTLGDGYYLILVDTSAARAITLPSPVNGRTFIIKDKTGTAETYNITLTRNGAESIEGVAANRTLSTNWGCWKVVSDGTNWFIIT